mgnify:CR=1 FL=1
MTLGATGVLKSVSGGVDPRHFGGVTRFLGNVGLTAGEL